ncbi:MAG: bifunctional phosphoribosyl-AMP cyclohydrolase/phosphoribosyl-ATP diphosphatase HisIE [Chloroflexi bacterium]|nr:bifunctional phosphoribosyl-AMP cyclohydrolase/phosphoribosyl-ATP diphosphatase HisIE [Chloroflexota bacterium]
MTMVIRYDERGLVPAIVQHAGTGEVLMLGYMNAEALRRTLESGEVWFFSRSRQALWHKGETSGNVLRLQGIRVDCDGDALLVQALPAGPTCHTGERSCFFRALPDERAQGEPAAAGPAVLAELFDVVEERWHSRPAGSYTAYLFEKGVDKIGKKIGEEAAEVIIAAKNGEPGPIAAEVADLWFHTLVLLAACRMTPAPVWAELARRRKPAGRTDG